jgi:hypothetical protein
VVKMRSLSLRLTGIGLVFVLNVLVLVSIPGKAGYALNANSQIDSRAALRQNSQDMNSSGFYTHVDTVDTNWSDYQGIPDSFELVGENTTFKLYVDKTTLAFKVVDKRSGYVWHSNLDELAKGDRLNKTWTAFAKSGVSIDYLDPKAINKRASITNADHTLDVKNIDQGVEATLTFTEAAITFLVRIQLENNGVSVEVPFEAIREENPDYKLGILHLYPFMGATRADSVPGYMFIPDGSGSLIRFSKTTKAKNMYYGRYYGADIGMTTLLPYDPMSQPAYNASIPVTGMVHGYMQNAFITVVEKGASYGEIQAHPSGIITNFNFIYNAFIYNESYFQATNRSGDGVTTIQRKTNAFDIQVHYRFLTQGDSDYVGMAKSYQQYLVEKEVLKKVDDPDSDIGIRLEFLGGEKEKVLFWYRTIPMTTVSQMAEIVADLNVKNADVVYYGWQPFGASAMAPKSLKVDSKLGSSTQLRSFIRQVRADGGRFYLYLNPQAALVNESGYSPRYDLAMSITDSNLKGYKRHTVMNYFNFEAVNNRYSHLSKDVYSKLGVGLALDGIGSMLYSDFKSNHLLNREDAIAQYDAMFTKNAGDEAFYAPNDYMFGHMNAYFDMPLTNSGYIYTTDVVPFLQIAMAGYVPYYGTALNFSSNLKDDLLRHVDFGICPSYFLSDEVTARILHTRSNWIYSSSYAQWKGEVEDTYQWLDKLLGPVKGQEIIARQVLEDGVVATTYGNGKQIVVNYTDQPVIVGDLTVGSQDAGIRDVTP